MTNLRIGQGYDVHRLVEGRKLILGGVDIPWTMGLLGHSDADVLVHAIMDALLGAAGKGDIGKAFPDNDPALENIDSLILLDRTMEILRRDGFQPVNVDATVVAQRPKLAVYVPQMRENIAARMGLPVEQVNVKATTEEKLGFTGDSSGMAAHAVALIEKTK
jgi:2-C-methyl-D-erythritol 2,4-cyclodiphosphate synthase